MTNRGGPRPRRGSGERAYGDCRGSRLDGESPISPVALRERGRHTPSTCGNDLLSPRARGSALDGARARSRPPLARGLTPSASRSVAPEWAQGAVVGSASSDDHLSPCPLPPPCPSPCPSSFLAAAAPLRASRSRLALAGSPRERRSPKRLAKATILDTGPQDIAQGLPHHRLDRRGKRDRGKRSSAVRQNHAVQDRGVGVVGRRIVGGEGARPVSSSYSDGGQREWWPARPSAWCGPAPVPATCSGACP